MRGRLLQPSDAAVKNRTLPTNNHLAVEDESEILIHRFHMESMIFIGFSTPFSAFCLGFSWDFLTWKILPPGVCNETLDDIRMSSKKFITAIVVLITSNTSQKDLIGSGSGILIMVY